MHQAPQAAGLDRPVPHQIERERALRRLPEQGGVGDLNPGIAVRPDFAVAPAAQPAEGINEEVAVIGHAHGLDRRHDQQQGVHALRVPGGGQAAQRQGRPVEPQGVGVDHVERLLAEHRQCVGDSAALSLDDVAHAVADGDLAELERAFDRALAEGANPIQPLRATANHFKRLHQVADARDVAQAVEKLRPPVFWKLKPRLTAQAKAWSPARLGEALDGLLEAESRCKSTGMPVEAVAARELMRIASRSPLHAVQISYRGQHLVQVEGTYESWWSALLAAVDNNFGTGFMSYSQMTGWQEMEHEVIEFIKDQYQELPK